MKSATENIEQSLIENERFIEAMESHANSKNGNLFGMNLKERQCNDER